MPTEMQMVEQLVEIITREVLVAMEEQKYRQANADG